ncbi:MAG: ABC transporter substrate-binding protein, partial [Clostridia bacterium]|nr:ABC transporter substrate-binding protein [Clostridia bacterium]
MKKNIFISALLLFIINFESVFAEKQSLKIGILNGPSAIPSSYLIENKENFKTSIPDFQLFSGADTELPKILKGEIDIGILPPNAAAKVYNSSNKIIMLAVIGNGNVSLLTTKDDFKNLASLKGTTVYCAGRGATPDNIFRYILSENNIQISDEKNKSESVTLDFSIPTQDLATSIVSGKTDYILVPEPFATVALIKGKNSGVKKVFNLSDSFTDNYPLTLLVCNKNSLSEKKDAVDEYLSLYKNAVKWTIENPEEAGAYE